MIPSSPTPTPPGLALDAQTRRDNLSPRLTSGMMPSTCPRAIDAAGATAWISRERRRRRVCSPRRPPRPSPCGPACWRARPSTPTAILYFSDIISNRIYRLTPDGVALGLPRGQRPDQRQHVRRPGPAGQLRGGRVRAGRPPAGRPHRPADRPDRGPHRPLRGQAVQQPQRRRRRHPGPDLVHRPVLRRRPLGAGAGRRGRLPDRPRRHGHAGADAARRSSGPTAWRSRPTPGRST